MTEVSKRPAPLADPAYTAALSALENLGSDNDYAKLKKLQRHLEYISLQEEYIKDEQRYALLSPFFSCFVTNRR
jgi:26S proteasome regulatory subunit T3